jgi:phosphopantetheinyl transferase (holo-ACP synthase)
MKIIEKDFNIITGEETITERDMTSKELAQYEENQAAYAAQAAELAAKAAEKEALLARLGITEEEAKLLLG